MSKSSGRSPEKAEIPAHENTNPVAEVLAMLWELAYRDKQPRQAEEINHQPSTLGLHLSSLGAVTSAMRNNGTLTAATLACSSTSVLSTLQLLNDMFE
jgi:hypothetical protein